MVLNKYDPQYMDRIYSIPDFTLFTTVNIGIPVSKQHL